MGRLSFRRGSDIAGLACYSAKAAPWQFVIISDRGKWTVSHRLIDPRVVVSASSTIQGPFDSFEDAWEAAEIRYQQLALLS